MGAVDQTRAVSTLHRYECARKGPVVANVNPRLRDPPLGCCVGSARIERGHYVRDIRLRLGGQIVKGTTGRYLFPGN